MGEICPYKIKWPVNIDSSASHMETIAEVQISVESKMLALFCIIVTWEV